MDIIERTVEVEIGAEARRLHELADPVAVERADLDGAGGTALGRDVELQLQRLGIVADVDARGLEIRGRERRLAGEAAAECAQHVRIEDVGEQVEEAVGGEFDPVFGADGEDDVAEITRSVLRRHRQGDRLAGGVEAGCAVGRQRLEFFNQRREDL